MLYKRSLLQAFFKSESIIQPEKETETIDLNNKSNHGWLIDSYLKQILFKIPLYRYSKLRIYRYSKLIHE